MTATFARQPNGERTCVLRPQDPALALKRLSEWNSVLDTGLPGAEEFAEEHWVGLLKEQPWAFLGFLDETTKQVLGHDEAVVTQAQPGDLHVAERKFAGWGPAGRR